MPDQPAPPAAYGPPVSPASQLSVAVTPGEVILTLGVTRNIIGKSGNPDGGSVAEWTSSHALSPITARSLAVAMQTAVTEYEKQYGVIPASGSTNLETTSASA